MFDTIFGLPVHALVVHGVVVLLPLMALVSVVWAWRRPGGARAGWAVVTADLVVLVMTFVAKESGEALQRRLGGRAAIEHGELADSLPLIAGALLVTALLVQVHRTRDAKRGPDAGRDRDAGAPGVRSGLATGLSVLVSLAALVVVVWTIRVGHSGAQAVWGDIVTNTTKAG